MDREFNRRLEGYIRLKHNAIEPKLCKKTLKLLKNEEVWTHHSYHDYVTKVDVTHDDDLDVTNRPLANHHQMMEVIKENIEGYINELGRPYFRSWGGFSGVRYNRYNPGTTMQLHCDHITSLFPQDAGVPILTVLGLLNDDFTGGEFQLFYDNEDVIPLEKGDIIIFPSCFLYPHRVTPVIKGVRYSFVSWVW